MHAKIMGMLVCALYLAFPCAGTAEIFKLTALSNYPPFSAYSQSEGWHGFIIDITERLIETPDNAHQLEYIQDPAWKWALEGLKDGKLDFLWEVSYTKERAEFIEYIGATDVERLKLVVPADVPFQSIDTLDDFITFSREYGETPVQITYDEIFFYSEEFSQRMKTDPGFAQVFKHDHDILSIMEDTVWAGLLVSLGRIPARILSETDANMAIDKAEQLAKRNSKARPLKAMPIPAFGSPTTYIVVPKIMKEEYKTLIKNNYQQARADGSFDEIWYKWFKDKKVPPNEMPD